jgi:ATP-dependent RNA helicase DeaD
MNEEPSLPGTGTLAGAPLNAGVPGPTDGAPALPKGPSFVELGLHADVLRAVEEMGFSEPMPVQATTYPLITAGRDLMVQSRTGSGKTAAFGIPFANGVVVPEDRFVQAIVLLPTRELALQVAAELAKICAYRGITVVPVYGGAPMGRQVEQLRAGAQMICGTPGRVLDHLRRGTLRLDRVRCAVLDECDEMLSMGFQEDIESILEKTPVERQTLLFSATVPEGIQRLSRRFLRNPEFLKLSGDFVGVHEIKHLYYSIPGIHREQELLRILTFEDPKSAIIFCNTRDETGRVAEFLRQHGHDAEAISSDLSQADRERVLGRMRVGGIKFLVATDVAARGIDIENLSYVFNYTFPEAPELYIHRTGRTGRAGKQGTAVSLIGPTEVGSFYYLKLLYKIRPEERSLPSEVEIRSRREGERVMVLREGLVDDPGADWKALARRLMGAVDGERLIAALLARSFASVEGMPAPPKPAPAPVQAAVREPRPEPRDRDRDRDRDRPRDRDRDRDRHRTGGRDAPRTFTRAYEPPQRPLADTPRDPLPPREAAPRDAAPPREADGADGPPAADESPRPGRERSERPSGERVARDRDGRRERRDRDGRPERPSSVRGPRRGPPPPRTDPEPPVEREFWEVWGEERSRPAAAGAPPPAPTAPLADAGDAPDAPRASGGGAAPEGDVARLYLNLGRKDGAGEREIIDLLAAHAEFPPPLSMDVMNTHTYLNVAPEHAEEICRALTGKELAGRELVCEPAKPRRR